MRPLNECLLYGILDLSYISPDQLPDYATQMIGGGVDIIQLRAKDSTPDEIQQMATGLAPLLATREVPFIINDHPALVTTCGANGCHVGQDDDPISAARSASAQPILVGKSTHSVTQATAAIAESPDYIGFGPLFATPTKPDYQPIGIDDIEQVHSLVNLPIFCIGGIKLENLEQILAAGAQRVVIVSGILQANDITVYCREVKDKLVENFAKTQSR